MISTVEAEKRANRVAQSREAKITGFRAVVGGWAFHVEPRFQFSGSDGYWPPAIIVRADGRCFQTDGASPLQRELKLRDMSLG
jgi:hypothetical protein